MAGYRNILPCDADSLTVEVGDTVLAGQQLGYLAASGPVSRPRLLFRLEHNGNRVDPFVSDAYWNSPMGYLFDHTTVFDSGLTNYDPDTHRWWEGTSRSRQFLAQDGNRVYASAKFNGLHENDVSSVVWYDPSGQQIKRENWTVDRDRTFTGYDRSLDLTNTTPTGIWRVDFEVNGTVLGSEQFEVLTVGVPEIRLEHDAGEHLVSNRYTPIDLGIVNLNSATPVKEISVINPWRCHVIDRKSSSAERV